MNREHLYRGQRRDTKEWEYGYLLVIEKKPFIFPIGAQINHVAYYGDNGSFGILGSGDVDECIGSEGRKPNKWLCEVIPGTVGQCLFLPDKNGKIIYEGDLIKHIRNSRPYSNAAKHKQVICLVQWDTGHGGNKGKTPSSFHTCPEFNAYPVNPDLPESKWGYDWSPFHNCEIVGNKWDNPELLKNK
jgi:hypothetical protein